MPRPARSYPVHGHVGKEAWEWVEVFTFPMEAECKASTVPHRHTPERRAAAARSPSQLAQRGTATAAPPANRRVAAFIYQSSSGQ